MPDIANLLSGFFSNLPDLGDAFVRGAQYALGAFILVGMAYALRRYL